VEASKATYYITTYVITHNESTIFTQMCNNAAYKIPPALSQCSRFCEDIYAEDI
jgi:hypothetical protein